MSKKLYKPAVHASTIIALAALDTLRADIIDKFGLDIAADSALLKSNLPLFDWTDPETAETITVPLIALNEAGQFAFHETTAIGTLATIIHYTTATVPQQEGAPLLIPETIYLINLPTEAEILTSPKLAKHRETLITTHQLAAAKKLAAMDAQGKPGFQIDRIGALMAAAARSSASSLEASYRAMHGFIRGTIQNQVNALADRLTQTKQFQKRKELLTAFSSERLSRDMLKQVFSSAGAAEYYFPQMAQAQWENILRYAAASAPKFRVARIVKDTEGKALKRINDEGKEETVKEIVEMPLEATIFLHWLGTRNEVAFSTPEASDAPALTFEGLVA